jgi:hypothetical protein
MALFIILSPFATFGLLLLIVPAVVALFSAAALVTALIVRDAITGRSIKMLSVGSLMIFLGLGSYVLLVDAHFSPAAIRIVVDLGVLTIALASVAIRLPFSMQYAREKVDPSIAALPDFLTSNYIITFVWIAAFTVMVIADMLLIVQPGLPLWIGVAIAMAARNSAIFFTRWYSAYQTAKGAAQAR